MSIDQAPVRVILNTLRRLGLILFEASAFVLASCQITRTVSTDDTPASGATVFDMYVL
jgi:hypothetical protein